MKKPNDRNKAQAQQARKLQNPEVRTARISCRELARNVVALAVSCVPRDAVENYQYEDAPGAKRRHDIHHDLYGPFKPTGPKYLFR